MIVQVLLSLVAVLLKCSVASCSRRRLNINLLSFLFGGSCSRRRASLCSALLHWFLLACLSSSALACFSSPTYGRTISLRALCSVAANISNLFNQQPVSLSFGFQSLLCFFTCLFSHAASEDEVGACTRRILVFYHSFQSLRYTLLGDVVFPIACARVVVRPGRSTKIEMASRLVPSLKGEGINNVMQCNIIQYNTM